MWEASALPTRARAPSTPSRSSWASQSRPPCLARTPWSLLQVPWSPDALTLPSHRRTFLQAVSSEKVRATNLNCSVIADVRHDGSEPCVDVLFGKHDRDTGGRGRSATLALHIPGPLLIVLHLPQEMGIG